MQVEPGKQQRGQHAADGAGRIQPASRIIGRAAVARDCSYAVTPLLDAARPLTPWPAAWPS